VASGMGPRAAMESLSAPTTAAPAAAAPAAGTMPRRTAVDEFNSIREGIRTPNVYDPRGATSSARRAATDVVRTSSDENRILQMAANIASDPRLKGFPGARNAIIAGLVGQIGASSNAALEGLRQQGDAGTSAQDFGQDSVLQETGRRGQVLRDEFLASNQERLQGLNNDAAMQRTLLSGLLSGQGRGRSGASSDEKLAERVFGEYIGEDGDRGTAAVRGLRELDQRGIVPSSTTAGTFGVNELSDRLARTVNSEDVFNLYPDLVPGETGANAFDVSSPWWLPGDNFIVETEDSGWDFVDPEQLGGLTYEDVVAGQRAARRDEEARRRLDQ